MPTSKILIADDNLTNVELLEAYLAEVDCEIATAADGHETLDRAVERLAQEPQIRLAAQSRWRETPPVGGPPGQGPFLNGAAVLHTSLEPEALLAVLARIETRL